MPGRAGTKAEVSRGFAWLVLGTAGVLSAAGAALAATTGSLGIIGIGTGGPVALSIVRNLAGAAFLGAVTDAMLLGHWYLVQPRMSRDPIRRLTRAVAYAWPFEVLVFLIPVGMISVFTGAIDDGYNGLLGWFWAACVVATIALTGATYLALRERGYAAVMAATGLLYLAILTASGTDLVARAILGSASEAELPRRAESNSGRPAEPASLRLTAACPPNGAAAVGGESVQRIVLWVRHESGCRP